MKNFMISKVEIRMDILNKLLFTAIPCLILGVANADINDISNPIQINKQIDSQILDKIGGDGSETSATLIPISEDEFKNLLVNETTSTLKDLYQANGFNLIWTDAVYKHKFLYDYILVAVSETNKFAWNILKQIDSATGLEQDIAITRALLDYINYNDLAKQRIQQILYDNKNYKNNEPKSTSLVELQQALINKNLGQYLTSLEPINALYKSNMEYIKNIFMQNIKVEVPITANLRFRSKGAQVVELINKLKAKKYLPEDFNSEVYDKTVLEAVKQFQIDNKMKPDGIIGVNSRAKLNDNPLYSVYRLALNSQRIRMLGDFNDGLFVNIPSFELKYFQNGELKLTSRIIVGKGARKTPVMFSRLSDVVLNPPWNTPTKLINEDIIPKVKNDPSYIYRNGYTIIDSKGKSVDPYTIDWENYNSEKFPYRLRQKPSDNSALGSYKFNMPSKDAIFLHDTPSKGLFNRERRDLSSGCIRVEQSKQLANILLTEVGVDDIVQQQMIKNKKTRFVKLTQNTPVYIYYMTAWVDPNTGNMQSLPDLYGYDNANIQNIDWDLLKNIYNLK